MVHSSLHPPIKLWLPLYDNTIVHSLKRLSTHSAEQQSSFLRKPSIVQSTLAQHHICEQIPVNRYYCSNIQYHPHHQTDMQYRICECLNIGIIDWSFPSVLTFTVNQSSENFFREVGKAVPTRWSIWSHCRSDVQIVSCLRVCGLASQHWTHLGRYCSHS